MMRGIVRVTAPKDVNQATQHSLNASRKKRAGGLNSAPSMWSASERGFGFRRYSRPWLLGFVSAVTPKKLIKKSRAERMLFEVIDSSFTS